MITGSKSVRPGRLIKGEIIIIIKVNIETGEVIENKLWQFWARDSLRSGLKYPKRLRPAQCSHPAGQLRTGKVDRTLMRRIKRFSSKINKKSNSWREEELYRLAVLMGRKKMLYWQAGRRLARSSEACKYMYWKMKNEGNLI